MLITGGAKRVGAAIAEHFAAQGWNLVLHYHQSAAAAQALAQRLQQAHSVQVQLVQADLSDSATLAHFWQGLPACHAFVHSASTFERDTLATMQPAVLQQQLQVNFATPLVLAQGFMQQLPTTPEAGNIIILSDGVMGWSINPEFFSYAISKQAWLGALDVLATACAPRAKVNGVALAPTIPGAMDGANTFERLAEHAPLKRTSNPDEVCATVAYLLHAPGVTGQMISLAAGAHLHSYRYGA
jgi:NAD(P)-dependent dehydrogenase (short-subunit alcohol dehydrogenase family)